MSYYDYSLYDALYDPPGFSGSDFDEAGLDWDSLTSELRSIVTSEEFCRGDQGAIDKAGRLYNRRADTMNTMGCGWFMGFVAGALFASNGQTAEARGV